MPTRGSWWGGLMCSSGLHFLPLEPLASIRGACVRKEAPAIDSEGCDGLRAWVFAGGSEFRQPPKHNDFKQGSVKTPAETSTCHFPLGLHHLRRRLHHHYRSANQLSNHPVLSARQGERRLMIAAGSSMSVRSRIIKSLWPKKKLKSDLEHL